MTTEPSNVPAAPTPKPKKRRRWRRRFIWAGCILVALGLAIRILLPLSLPIVLRKIAGIYGMNCAYDRLELNSLSGDAGIWGLEFTPKEGGPPILSADYCHGNLSVLNLFRGKLNVWRLEADGVDANIDRNPDGHIPLLDRFIGAATPPPVTVSTPAKPTGAKPGEIDLASPLRLDALRLEHLRVHIHDRGVNPPLDTELAMELRLSDLGSPTRPARFELNLSADPILDTLRITGQGRSGGKVLDASFDVLGRGLHLRAAVPYLAPLGIRPVSDDLTLTAAGHIHTGSAKAGKDGFAGTMQFDHLSATADGRESLALDRITVDADAINPSAIHLNRIVLDGVRATAGRGSDGNFGAAGVEYDPSLLSTARSTPTAPPAPLPPILIALASEPWSIGECAVRNARLDLHDQRVSPQVDVSLIADELSAKSIVHDPLHLDTTITLTGLAHAPGLVRDIKLVGAAQPFLPNKTFRGSVDATGIRPDAIRSYLDPIGVESRLNDGEFVAAVDASLSLGPTITANVKVPTFELRDGEPLFSLAAANVSNITLDTKTGKIGVGAIEVSGPGVSVVREPSGQLRMLGLRTKPVTNVAAAAPTPTTQPAASGTTIASLPRITVGRFAWDHVEVSFEDQTQVPSAKLSVTDVAVEASNLSTDLATPRAGRFTARLSSPALAKQLEAAGTITPSTNALRLDATVSGSGLDATPFAPYVKSLGIQPVLTGGAIGLHATAEVAEADNGLTASLGVDHVRYTQGAENLASVDDLQVKNLSLRGGAVGVDSIRIVRPHTAARRDADGTLVAGGIRLLPRRPADPNAAASPAATASPMAIPSMPFVVALKQLSVSEVSLDWSDHAVEPAVSTELGASVQLDNLTLGKDAPPATLLLTAHAAGSADELKVSGTMSVSPSQLSSKLSISATGLRIGPLAPYLPSGVGSSLETGHFQTTVDAAVSSGRLGGVAAKLVVGPLTFQDADQPPLLQMDSMRLLAPRIDLPYTAVDIDELSVAGVQTRAERTSSGELACMGLLLGGKAAPRTMPPPASVVPADAAPSVAAPASAPSVHDLIASAHVTLPEVTVDKLSLDVRKLTLTDEFRPSARPLVISELKIRNVNRIDWLGKNAAGRPATHLQLVCKIDPLIEHVQLDASVTPFARQPALQADFVATGVHGSGLTDLIPELKQQVSGASMTDGRIAAHLEAEAKLDRRSPLDFDVPHGLDLSFLLSNVSYRASPGGPVLAGVDEVRSEGIHIQPADSIVHVRALEITKPTGFVSQDAAGVHVLGWVYKMPTAQTAQPTTQPAVATVVGSVPPPRVAAPPPRGELRIDKLVISGLDFRVEDNAVQPPLVVPLNGLDVEVRNISTRLPYEDKPIRFSAIVNAGKVRLPIRGTPGAFEDRDLFSQMTANGEVALYPRLHGWAKTSVSGLDLAALRGPAEEFGETLTNGLYDSSVDLRFDPGGAIAVNSRFTLTDLSLSEPPNGPIYRYLHLPAPLDVAIGSVQGADGSISLPINVSVDPNHVSYADVGLAAAGGVSQVIVVALASAPLKAMNDMGALVGLGGAKKQPQSQTTTVPFFAGSSAYESSAALRSLLIRLRRDPELTVTVRHQLGGGDLRILQVRSNPTPEQCAALEAQLRGRHAELLQLRSEAAGVARAQLLSLGAPQSNGALEHLRAIDREIAATDDSLDQVGELLRPGADRLAERRTRSAALLVAADRLGEIKQRLADAGIAADRLRIVTPQFNPDSSPGGGQVVITTVKKK